MAEEASTLDLSELDDLERGHSDRCSMEMIYGRLSESDAMIVRAGMAQPMAQRTHRALVRFIKKRGIHVSDGIVSRHRRRECLCPDL